MKTQQNTHGTTEQRTSTTDFSNSAHAADGKHVHRNVKVWTNGNVAELKKAFITQLQLLKPHMFRMMHLMSAIRSKRSHLADHEMLLHTDFSENFTTKNLSEIQSAHFGSSLRQITLHIDVIYSGKFKSFCTISVPGIINLGTQQCPK